MELVSVIIPAHNAAAFIAETLASAQAQTYRDLEIIVVDDGSTDGTAGIVETIATRDTRVRLLRQPNCGVAAARNLAIRESRGVFVAPLDADDLWHPDKIARQVMVMRERGPEIGIVYAWLSIIDEMGNILPQGRNVPLHEGRIFPFLVLRNFVGNGSTPLLRRECVLEVGGYDSSLRARGSEGCEDLLLYLTIAARFEIALVPAFLVGYRMTTLGMSSNAWQMRRAHALVLDTIRAHHPELPSRVFRWSGALNCLYLSHASWRRGQLFTAVLLLARSFAYDPGLIFEPPLRRAIRRFAARLLQRTTSVDCEHETGTRFLDACAQPDKIVRLEPGFLSRRRHAFLMSQHRASSHLAQAIRQGAGGGGCSGSSRGAFLDN